MLMVAEQRAVYKPPSGISTQANTRHPTEDLCCGGGLRVLHQFAKGRHDDEVLADALESARALALELQVFTSTSALSRTTNAATSMATFSYNTRRGDA